MSEIGWKNVTLGQVVARVPWRDIVQCRGHAVLQSKERRSRLRVRLEVGGTK
jgi:hypothetical protein